MSKLKLNARDWIVVCDGRKALVLENIGDDVYPNLRTKEVYEHTDQPTREQGTDAPGRAHASVGSARSAVEQTDWHEEAERAFLEGLLRRLDMAVTGGETKALIFVAPPRVLGIIRKAASPHVQKAVRAEVDRDYVKLPLHKIEKHLVG